ncbi:MAG: lipid-A-disaccharide synthase [Nitrosopumilales archaeon]|nr:lipid-A-disaccharide synthase [Nitrosopumilales archaeon]
MKIWFDILTPKQLLFFEPIIQRLKKNHTMLCTSRKYNQVTDLAKIRKQKLVIIGKHGGGEKHDKLVASLSRSKLLVKKISRFSPDITLSFCSPEAARISYGLGIKHICFSDSPHAENVMRLVVPLVQKLLIPWIIPKKKFTKFGIDQNNIIQYKAIDAAIISKRKIKNIKKTVDKRIILIRLQEDEAAYSLKKRPIIPIIKEILKEFSGQEIVIMTRYASQKKYLQQIFQKKIKILSIVVDSKLLLYNADIFIGSGGTMTAESALLGIPTISYDAVPNIIEDYLVRKKLVMREVNPKKMVSVMKKVFKSSNSRRKNRAKKMMSSMEDPYPILLKTMKSILK